jgi:hypothetical protein
MIIKRLNLPLLTVPSLPICTQLCYYPSRGVSALLFACCMILLNLIHLLLPQHRILLCKLLLLSSSLSMLVAMTEHFRYLLSGQLPVHA